MAVPDFIPDSVAIPPPDFIPDSVAIPRVTVSAHTRKRPDLAGRMMQAGGMAPSHPDTGASPGFFQRPLPDLVTPSAILGLGTGMLGGAWAGPPGMALGGLLGGLGGGLLEGQKPPMAVLSGLAQSAPGVLEGLAGPLMQAALGTAKPAIARTFIAERAAATPQGVERAGAAIARQAGQTDQLVNQSPLVTNAQDFLQAVRQRMGKVVTAKLHSGANQAELNGLEDEFTKDLPAQINAADLHGLKQSAADVAAPAYGKAQAGKIPISDISQRWHKAVADEARSRLEAAIPGYRQSNAVTEALVRGKPLAQRGANQPPGIPAMMASRATAGMIGAGFGSQAPGDPRLNALLGGLAGATVGTPGNLSRLSLLLTDPRFQGLLRTSPGLLGGAVQRWGGGGGAP